MFDLMSTYFFYVNISTTKQLLNRSIIFTQILLFHTCACKSYTCVGQCVFFVFFNCFHLFFTFYVWVFFFNNLTYLGWLSWSFDCFWSFWYNLTIDLHFSFWSILHKFPSNSIIHSRSWLEIFRSIVISTTIRIVLSLTLAH